MVEHFLLIEQYIALSLGKILACLELKHLTQQIHIRSIHRLSEIFIQERLLLHR